MRETVDAAIGQDEVKVTDDAATGQEGVGGTEDVSTRQAYASETTLEPEGEAENPPTSDPLVISVVDTLQEQLVSEHTESPPASPTVMMPSVSKPEPRPTTGPALKCVLNRHVEIPPSPAPS